MLDSTPKFVVTACLTLDKTQVFRIPANYHRVKVMAGTAWFTIEGRDVILTPGETLALHSKTPVLVSVLGNKPLTLLAWQDELSTPPDKPVEPFHRLGVPEQIP